MRRSSALYISQRLWLGCLYTENSLVGATTVVTVSETEKVTTEIACSHRDVCFSCRVWISPETSYTISGWRTY